MTTEYYDRNLASDRPCRIPANRASQDYYWLLRSRLTQAIAANFDAICQTSPEVASAAVALKAYVAVHPRTVFSTFKPEDLRTQHDADSTSLFLR